MPQGLEISRLAWGDLTSLPLSAHPKRLRYDLHNEIGSGCAKKIRFGNPGQSRYDLLRYDNKNLPAWLISNM
jgi:hypothetical protein